MWKVAVLEKFYKMYRDANFNLHVLFVIRKFSM